MWGLVCRECIECQHFQRGQYTKDNSCGRICKDEIRGVEKLGKNYFNSDLMCSDSSVIF